VIHPLILNSITLNSSYGVDDYLKKYFSISKGAVSLDAFRPLFLFRADEILFLF
jgi:hypothetical protein